MNSLSARGAAHREIDALADRGGWSESARADAHALVETVIAGTTGPREIANRYRAIAKPLGRAGRARLWQVARRSQRLAHAARRGLPERPVARRPHGRPHRFENRTA